MTANKDLSAPGAGTPDQADHSIREPRQFISFRVDNEEFAIDIISVREIKGWTSTATLPNQPPYNRGVMNLRGTIVPIFDLRCRFGMGMTEATAFHVVIIASVMDRTIGLLVDAVSDILTIDTDAIRPVPDTEQVASTTYLSGIVTTKTGMVIILSLEKLFGREQTTAAGEIAA
ncbi:purine-binding chemotaxis protein CheW [Breoghania corrubedonensis]|uniref:Purine-binding chemotaxis protein CheW n=1 Tax=Breoghania corrubedonensis TaxID=665038 RepID=A0A2T5UU77_9HYPH|nr:chemotaxis protein CheW [Breoghania corrubedonensis]PTW55055.1 purine-binding chemotaxis protein CheW [Breoghania corrubedonensis]